MSSLDLFEEEDLENISQQNQSNPQDDQNNDTNAQNAEEEEGNADQHDSEVFVSEGTKEFINELYNNKSPKSQNDGQNQESATNSPPKNSSPNRQSYNDFIDRQDGSNQKKRTLRSKSGNREYEPSPDPKNDQIAPASKYTEWPKPREGDSSHVSPSKMSPRTKDLYEKSLKVNKTVSVSSAYTPTKHEISRANKSSIQLANSRYKRLIETVIGNSKTLNLVKFNSILKKFNIPYADEPEDSLLPRPFYCKIADLAKIDENGFDTSILKDLFCKAASGEPVSGLANQIRPTVMGALSNMKPVMVCPYNRAQNPNQSSSMNSPQKNSPSKTSPQKSSPRNESNKNSSKKYPKISINKVELQHSSDYDEDEEPPVLKVENTPPKKEVKPVRRSPTGANYLPGFYDNIDFFVAKPPSKV
ncbi:hypothetical protein TRFO_17419 [Tritrichomonas foetus]|uniref:Uncharacterized protein n=1 Tax=Tritrichomonas foetus TaxID=1144522 RepID=A0A1J4KN87_9EUKA|nr:hypothetical protein TRFO_17419 [Tritrichomonas foetus]|eukprot:OHT12699.1 hypothetical protein TRFO_17419 [Tritrichomonas foetus]